MYRNRVCVIEKMCRISRKMGIATGDTIRANEHASERKGVGIRGEKQEQIDR